MPDQDISTRGQAEGRVIVGYTDQHISAGSQTFHHDNADIVSMFVDKQVGDFSHL